MKKLLFAAMIAMSTPAIAQQAPAPMTDWRAALDNDISKLSMPRDAHLAIFQILQAYERQAQAQKAAPPAEPPKN
jgi:hypothetical protein